MANDREILKEVWEGKVAICFKLSLDEVISSSPPDDLYLLVPRQTYFPVSCEKVEAHFLQNVAEAECKHEIWFEFEGEPLKWHYPVGVLFDMHSSRIQQLPWNVTVHFQNFPEGQLLHCSNKDVVEAHFMSRLKEADCLKHNGDVINSMQKKDHNQLWLGLKNYRFEQFWEVNRKLMESADGIFKHIPYYIHQTDKPVLQKLYKPVSSNGELCTLKDLLLSLFPLINFDTDNKKVMLQGVQPPLETSIQWLSEHFSHPDNFLHICLVSV